jgi:hypothetical protein
MLSCHKPLTEGSRPDREGGTVVRARALTFSAQAPSSTPAGFRSARRSKVDEQGAAA